MSERVPIDPERLLAQTAWVRRLARSLARDEASADDLAQESFVAALRRPPAGAADETRLRAWFGFVLRNMAFRRTRSDARREERERRSADGGRSDSDERAEELEELRAELFGHVKALPESSREVLLLHYFEELDSAEIARRLGVPDSTVRNRLRRALAELRERLERRHGADWRALCLFVLPRTGAQVAAGTGAVAAAGGLWFAGGAIAVVALALALWIGWRRSGEQAERPALAAVPVEIPRYAAGDDPQSKSSRGSESLSSLDSDRAPQGEPLRILVSDEYEPPPNSPFAHGIIVHGVVRDEAGEPLDGVQLRWTDPWGRSRGAGTSEGKYSANSFAPGLHVLRIRSHACAEEWHEVTLRADEELQSFDYVVSRTHAVPVYLLDPNDESLLQAGASGPAMRDACAWAVRTPGPPPATLRVQVVGPTGPEDYHPEWAFMVQGWERREQMPEGALGLIELNGPPPYFVSLVHLGNVLATQRLESIPERVTFRLERSLLDHSRQELLAARSWILGPNVTAEVPHPHADSPLSPAAPVHLQFLDQAARPVMACFKFQSPRDRSSGMVLHTGGLDWPGGVFSGAAHANGIFDWELEPGPYVLHITGTRNDDEPNFVRVGALPRRVEIGTGPDRTEIVVSLGPLRTVLLRSACTPEEAFRWKISTCDGLPVVEGLLIGHAPKSLGLPPGKFVLAIRARQDGVLLAEQPFEVDEKPLVLELRR
jgi:RNA polymerase sigma-70 factor (ECF subfamily)